jgi:hypothetical protein
MTLRVQCVPIFRIVVLLDAAFKVLGLTDVELASRIENYVGAVG